MQNHNNHDDDAEESSECDGANGCCAPILVVGHYCHDSIRLASGISVDALGGSVSYITKVFHSMGLRSQIVSKVGPDFAYFSTIHPSHVPLVVSGHHTTAFFADFTLSHTRVLRLGASCEPIHADNIPPHNRYDLALAVGVAGEILPVTLERMLDVSARIVVDVQALIRTIEPSTGLVSLRRLENTPFYKLLPRIAFLKAASDESAYLNVQDVRQKTCLIITQGKSGCTVYLKDRKFSVPAFSTNEVDPTGAGDSFLAGFSAGLYQGLSVERAAIMGNYFGALAVSQVGVPELSQLHLQELQNIYNGDLNQGTCFPNHWDAKHHSLVEIPSKERTL